MHGRSSGPMVITKEERLTAGRGHFPPRNLPCAFVSLHRVAFLMFPSSFFLSQPKNDVRRSACGSDRQLSSRRASTQAFLPSPVGVVVELILDSCRFFRRILLAVLTCEPLQKKCTHVYGTIYFEFAWGVFSCAINSERV